MPDAIQASDFSSFLFWDVAVDSVDLEDHRPWLVRRILATLSLLWCAIPIGIDPTPNLQNKSDLQEQDRAEIVAWLKRKDVIYGVTGKSHIYWPSFWKPWTRNQYRCWVLIEPKGAG